MSFRIHYVRAHDEEGTAGRYVVMELKTRVWMTGNLEWFAYIDSEPVFLGTREVPYPLREGDRWTNGNGVAFQVVKGSIKMNWNQDGMELY